MAKLVVRSVGRVRGVWQDAADVYLQRVQRVLPLSWQPVAQASLAPDADRGAQEAARTQEARRLLRGIEADAVVIALDEHGEQLDSAAFARRLAAWLESGAPHYLLIGGHAGHAQAVRERAGLLALSRLTFGHQMVPALLFEQIYRAYSILHGLPYHRA